MKRSRDRLRAGARSDGFRRGSVIALLLAVCLLASVTPAYGFTGSLVTSVSRFYNKSTGAHLYTTDYNEYISLLNNRAFHEDGIAYTMWNEWSRTPLHRFFNKKTGVHFYSADPDEVARVQATMSGTYRYEGVAYNVGTFGIAIHRFLNLRTGVHFYSADPVEVENVRATMTGTYRYEGIAFYAPQYVAP
jgi:Repeat of unknown function (DUF5648)